MKPWHWIALRVAVPWGIGSATGLAMLPHWFSIPAAMLSTAVISVLLWWAQDWFTPRYLCHQHRGRQVTRWTWARHCTRGNCREDGCSLVK